MKPKFRFLLLLVFVFLQSCHIGRFFIRNKANITDHKFFPSTPINTGNKTFQFAERASLDLSDFIPNYSDNEQQLPLDQYLDKKTTTTAFLVIHRDSIAFEKYYRGYSAAQISNIFSVSKSITSLMVGIAVDDGLIESVHDPVTKYLTELNESDPIFKTLTIEHLLEMRSGIKFKEAYLNPFAHVARLYYGKNQFKQIQKLKFEAAPDSYQNYQSISTAILGEVVERVTGKEMGKYLEEKVWIPMGMEFPASWSIDDKKNRSTKGYCCLNTTARDLAKIARLYLNDGNWNGQQIISKDWVLRSKTPNAANDCYQYQWYSINMIVGENNKVTYYQDSLEAEEIAKARKFASYQVKRSTKKPSFWYINYCKTDFYAVGILGQLILIDPEKELIVIRLGEKSDKNYGRILSGVSSIIKD